MGVAMSRISRIAVAALTLGLGSMALAPQAEAKFVSPYNHPDLDWYTIDTEHFAVHYPVSKKTAEEGNPHYINAEYSARRSAVESERMWPLMCGELNYFLKEKIHVVILDQSDYLEGFTIPSWDWIEISANPGGYFYRMRGRGEWFSDVLIHEFAHVVSLKASTSIAEGTGGILVGGLYSDGIRDMDTGVQFYISSNDAWWWTEGGAEFWSNNTGYYWWTSARDQNIRMTVLQDRLLDYGEWESRVDASDWGDGERGYQQGYNMALYIRERFGDETMARFAIEYSKGWRPNWDSVIEDVIGIDGRTLYNDWVAYVTEKYEAVEREIQADGQVEGLELKGSPGAWEFKKPSDRDEYEKSDRNERENERHSTGTWELEPKFSDDGKYFGYNGGRIFVTPTPEGSFSAFAGASTSDADVSDEASRLSWRLGTGATFSHQWDFIPGRDAVVLTMSEDALSTPFQYWSKLKLEEDGYDWKQLYIGELSTVTRKVKGEMIETTDPGSILGQDKIMDRYTAIPNTMRGTDPNVSPNGEQVVYIEYFDGGTNLVVINLDGTEKTYLTEFHDGTMFQRPDWSPDGTKVVFSMFRNYQNDLYMIDVASKEIEALTWDKHESYDPHWGHDGLIYFTSDPDGIYNIYRMDPATREVEQVTNVLGGASSPTLTPDGNLVYTMYTAFGFKIWGLAGDEFMLRDATHRFNIAPDRGEVQAGLDYSEDLSFLESATKKYKFTRAMMPPTATPLIRYGNDSMTNWGITAGFQLFMQDFVEDHGGVIMAILGEDTTLMAQYINQVWYPSFFLTVYRVQSKSDFARAFDADGNFSTTADQTYFEGEQAQVQNMVFGGMSYPFNGNIDISAGASALSFGFQTISDTAFEPFSWRATGFVNATYSNISQRNPLPRSGTMIDLNYAHGYTDIVYAPYYGVDTDDGQRLDAYHYNSYQGRITKYMPVKPIAGWDPLGLLGLARKQQHTFSVDLQGGYIDRNVQFNDEFRAGGRHPYWFGSGAVQPNTFFAGYPGFSLSGETMAILNAAYRFKVKDNINKKIGPLYVYRIDAQVMGTAGNLWSYRAPDDASKYYTDLFGTRVAYDEADLYRERPFRDYAYKNSPVTGTGQFKENYFLYDAGAEVRISSIMFNRAPWNSFVRVAYGFNEIRGVGDVNGDDVITTADNGLGDALSAESELPGVRVYIGIGTGW